MSIETEVVESAGVFAGVTPTVISADDGTGAGGTLGIYNGPVCPHAVSTDATITPDNIVQTRFLRIVNFTIIVANKLNALECSMTESEFLTLANDTFNQIETQLDFAIDHDDLDIEWNRLGNVLEIECLDNGTKIILNLQTPMQELWIAAKSGGFHFHYQNNLWLNTRDQSNFFDTLSHVVSEQSGTTVNFSAQ